MFTKKKVAVLGIGKLGETLVRALLEAKVLRPDQILATAKHADTVRSKSTKYGIRAAANADAAREADILILAVKPQAMAEVLTSIRKSVSKKHIVISTAASVSTGFIERTLGRAVPVIRVMPNTPCLLRSGMTGIAPGKSAKREHLAVAEQIFNAMGRTIVLDERYMDAVTGLSGSGPAFLYVVLEALAEGGVKVGLPREIATELVAQTMFGAAKMVLETREHPAKLKDVVTTPAGCTIDGLLELEDGGLRVALIKAVVKATQRASELLHD
jgi:pyrroline-5-carboxylate reductase